jgi:hypothetical protein
VRNEADAAAVMFVRWIVEALRYRVKWRDHA